MKGKVHFFFWLGKIGLDNEKNLWTFIGISATVHLILIFSNMKFALPPVSKTFLEVSLIEVGKPNKPPGQVKEYPPEVQQPMTMPVFERKEMIQPEFHEPLTESQITEVISSPARGSSVHDEPVASGGGGGIDEALFVYLMMVKKKIEEGKQYPSDALKKDEEGEVHLKFTILQDGSVKNISIIKSSGSRILDEASVQLMKRVSPFFPPPGNYSRIIKVPINYEIKR